MAILFRDRIQAASMLSSGIKSFVSKHNLKNIVRTDNNDVIIMAIPNGGVVTADIVAINLERTLDILISAKIGAPFNSEFEIGAVTHDGEFFPNKMLIEKFEVPQQYINDQISSEVEKILVRLKKLRGTSSYRLNNKTVILIDDGISTGLSMSTAAKWISSQNIRKLIIAAPFGPKNVIKKLKEFTDAIIVLNAPLECEPVGEYYQYFPEVSDRQVYKIMQKYKHN